MLCTCVMIYGRRLWSVCVCGMLSTYHSVLFVYVEGGVESGVVGGKRFLSLLVVSFVCQVAESVYGGGFW